MRTAGKIISGKPIPGALFSVALRSCVRLTSALGVLGLSFAVAAWRLGVRVSPHIKRTTCGLFARKLARAAALALAVLCLFGGASREAGAQRAQEGPQLGGSGVQGVPRQGTSVAVSADGNTAIVGGPDDGGANGAAWVFIQNNGA